MSINFTRCEGTGFLNVDQFPEFVDDAHHSRRAWLKMRDDILLGEDDCQCEDLVQYPGSPKCVHCLIASDTCVCDCCGDGVEWYGEPGEHYNAADPRGTQGPYADNGGLCQCH